MPRREWSFFMPAEDHVAIKRFLAFLRSRMTPWGQIILAVILPGMVIASGKTQLSAYLFPSFILALLLTSFLLSLLFRPRLSAVRVLPPPPQAGGKYVYRVVVKNTGHQPIRNLAVFEDTLPFGLYAEPGHPLSHNSAEWLDPGQEATLALALRTPYRGVYELPRLIAGSAFPSGITRVTVHAGYPEKMTVYPRPLHCPGLPDSFRRMLQPGGIPFSSKTGDSNEFVSTREYREGDRLRDVHWTSSARAGKLIIKEYIEESFTRVGIFLDTARDRFEKRDSLEARISLCAGIAGYLNDGKYLFDLYLSERTSPHVEAAQGMNSLGRLLQRLALVEGAPQVDLDLSRSHILRDAACLSMLVLLLKDWDGPRAEFTEQLRKAGLKVQVIIVSSQPTALKPPDGYVSVHRPQELKEKKEAPEAGARGA